MAVYFQKVKEITAKVAKALSKVSNIRVTTPNGTNVTLSVAGRKIFALDGFFQAEMGFAALPGGECPTSPVEGTTNGTIVIDYSMDSMGRLRQPLVFTVKNGRVILVDGSPEEANAIERAFEKDENARNIAEFSIGTNPGARLIGNLAEDKKALGTVHFAIGDNRSLGGVVEATIHLDGLMLKPTVIGDNENVIVENGDLRI